MTAWKGNLTGGCRGRREGYDAATRGDFDVDGWKEKIRPDQILQLGVPCAGCWVHEPEGNHRAASQ
jgi:hypothetical protein